MALNPPGCCCTGAKRHARRTHTVSHIDGVHAAPTRFQAQYGCPAAPRGNWEGQGSVQGALRGPQGEIIYLDHESMISPELL